MNISELARQLKTEPQTLREKLPELGIHIGVKAIQIDDASVPKAIEAWRQYERKEALKQKLALKKQKQETVQPTDEHLVTLPPSITVSAFAKKLKTDVSKVIIKLMQEGVMAAMNQKIDYETASIVAEDFGFKPIRGEAEEEINENNQVETIIAKESALVSRPPVVVVMGHVDHGKTTLLDTIRKTKVAEQEAGAITQHMGAYQITVETPLEYKGRVITFIDTPGHEAFRGMRSRGGKVADLAVLVVAADDKIQPQTLESLDIIQKEKLALIVAINKIDKPEADVDRIKGSLSEIGLTPEDWGGDTICVPLSAKAGTNIDQLLEHILLVAEVEDLKANPAGQMCGTIIESHTDKGLGPVSTGIIQNGTLTVGMLIKCGDTGGKIKGLQDFTGKTIPTAGPSTPVRILGLKTLPQVGDVLMKAESLKEIQKLSKKFHTVGAALFTESEVKKAPLHQLKIFLKTDVLGTLEALEGEISKLKYEDAEIRIVKKALGAFTENDVLEAEASNARMVGFKVEATPGALHFINARNLSFKTYTVIYQLLDDLKAALLELIPPEVIEEDTGEAKILATFSKSGNTQIVGGRVTVGKALASAKVRIFREGEILGEGTVIELQYNKSAAKEILAPQEFGIKLKSDIPIKENDVLQFYTVREEKRSRTS